MSTIYLAPADVPDVFKRAFPSYRGRTYAVEAAESVQLTDNYWSGGTKYTYHGVDIATGQVFNPECQEYGNPFIHPDVPTVVLEPGKAVVCHRVFCGKDMGIKILVHPDNLRKLLSDDRPQLSEGESRALAVVRSIKGSHHRRDEWDRRSLPGSYGAENSLIRSLADKGLVTVNRAGAVAVTLAGRNAAA